MTIHWYNIKYSLNKLKDKIVLKNKIGCEHLNLKKKHWNMPNFIAHA